MEDLKHERLQRLLLEDDFIRFIARNGQKFYIVDSFNESFLKVPNIVGIFKKNNDWIVYDTDDNAKVTTVGKFETQLDAYDYAVSIDNLEFTPSNLTTMVKESPMEVLESEKLTAELEEKIHLITSRLSVGNLYHEREEIKSDIEFLQDFRINSSSKVKVRK